MGNYGYDVALFFNVLDRLDLDCFDYVIKLHTKRDTPKCWVNFTPFEGGQWRRSLLSFCATPEAARRTLAAFARRPRLGMVAARALIDPSGVGAGRSGGMADTRDLKSLAGYLAYGFESRLRHQCRIRPADGTVQNYGKSRRAIYPLCAFGIISAI